VPYPVFAIYTLAFALQLSKKAWKTPLMAVVKCPDIPVAEVQYTFTHKQYTKNKQYAAANNAGKKKNQVNFIITNLSRYP
jgi:hypothetical protein